MKNYFIAIGKAALYALSFFAAQFIGVFTASLLYVLWHSLSPFAVDGVMPDVDMLFAATMDFITAYASIIGTAGGLCLLLALCAFFRLRGKRLCVETGWLPNDPAQKLLSAACAVCLAYALSMAMELLPIPKNVMENYIEASAETLGDDRLLIFLCTVFCGPVVEEVIFRGLVYTRLRRAMPVWLAVLIESLAFGLMHGDPLWIAYAFCMGCVMTLIYEKGGGLWSSICFHVTFNLFGAYIAPWLAGASALLYAAVLVLGLAGGGSAFVKLCKRAKKEKLLPDAPDDTLRGGQDMID